MNLSDSAVSSPAGPAAPVAPPSLFALAPYRRVRGAVPAWLLSWADPGHEAGHPDLHARGRQFLDFLLASGGRDPAPPGGSVTVHRRLDGADVVAELEGGPVLVVVEREERQERYRRLDAIRARLSERFGPGNLCPVYLELGNQPNHLPARAAGFHVIERRTLLDYLAGGPAPVERLSILGEYRDHLEAIERASHGWRTRPPDDWCDRSWQGFLSELRERIRQGSWGRLSGRDDRIWALWWNWRHRPDAPVSYFLRIEEADLCFKLTMQRYEYDALCNARAAWERALRDAAAGAGLDLTTETRPGCRATQTVCRVADFRRFGPDDRLDLEATAEVVKAAERVFEDACAELGAVSTGGRP